MTVYYAEVEWRRGRDRFSTHVVSTRRVGRYRFGLCGQLLQEYPDGHGQPPRRTGKCARCKALLPERVR